MYVDMDEKGRLLIPAKWRKKHRLFRRVELLEKGSDILVRGTVKPDFWLTQGGFLQKELKIKPLTAEELDDVAEKAMMAEMAQKFARIQASRRK